MISSKVRYFVIALFFSFGFLACSSNHNLSSSQHKVLSDTLGNGLRVVIIQDTISPVVTTQITYKTGGYETPDGYPGTAHALEHMMFRDIKGLTGAQLNEITGKMGGTNNAFTTMDATQYFFLAPSQYTDILLHIESLRMRGALLKKSDWALEKGAIEQEVSRDISNPSYLAYQKALSILFAGTGYAHTALGTRPSFDKNTSKIIRNFYDKWYQPNNAVFVIAGDVNPQKVFSKVKDLFGNIPRKPVPEPAPVNLQPFESQTIHKTTPSGTGSVEILYRMPGMQSENYAAAEILFDVLNNARSNLSKLTVEGKVLSSGGGLRSFAHAAVGIVRAGFAKSTKPQQTVSDLDAVINHVLNKGVPKDLVKAAKQAELAHFEFAKNSAMSLAGAWSHALAWRGLPSLEAAEQQIRNVSVEDVNQVADKYFTRNQRVTIILTPSSNGKRPPHSRGFGGTETFASNAKLNVPLPSWASKALSTLEMPHWTLNPTQTTLDNGITLVVQPTSVSKTVTVRGFIDHSAGLQEPPGKEGVGRVLNSLFGYGTENMDREAFHRALDKISASEYAGTSFGMAVPSKHFDRGMQLLAANVLHPALPDSGFKVKQQTIARRLAGRMHSPRYKLSRALFKGLYPKGDPGLRHPTPKTIRSLTLQDVKNYYNKVYRPDLATIVIVGDVSVNEAKSAVKKYFGDWKASGPTPDVTLKPVPLNPATHAFISNSYSSQNHIIMAQTLPVTLNDSARYALKLGNMVLGGNGFASRLMVDIRVNHGYAYGASSGMSFGRTRSFFFVSYGSDPNKMNEVNSLIYKNIAKMRNKLITPGEMKNARQAEIRMIPLRVSSVAAIAGSLLSWSRNGQPLNEPMVAARHYMDISAKQVRHAFKKYLKPNHFVRVVEGHKAGISESSNSGGR